MSDKLVYQIKYCNRDSVFIKANSIVDVVNYLEDNLSIDNIITIAPLYNYQPTIIYEA